MDRSVQTNKKPSPECIQLTPDADSGCLSLCTSFLTVPVLRQQVHITLEASSKEARGVGRNVGRIQGMHTQQAKSNQGIGSPV